MIHYKNPDSLKALVVDDDVHYLRFLKDFLEDRGFIVTTSSVPAEALKIAEACQKNQTPFHVAVIDYLMPEMDGTKFSRQIKKITPTIYNIIMTGYDTIENISQICKESTLDQGFGKGEDIEIFELFLHTAVQGVEENNLSYYKKLN